MSRNVADDASNTDKTTPVFLDRYLIIDSETNPDSLKEIAGTNLTTWLAKHLPIPLASGQMVNGKISVTVVSNDLVLALKTLAGADPSAADPVYININGTIRTITAATSCTLADGTSWMNLGSAELGTLEQDLFAYAIWDSNSSVVAVAPARIPYARLVSDFSATTTNEKHIGNYANYTTTDDVCVIGRFAATLSLSGTGHLWTVPAFTNSNLIDCPIFETRWLTYAPTITGYSANPTSTTYRYQVVGLNVHLHLGEGATGTSNATTKTYTTPFASKNANQYVLPLPKDNGAFKAAGIADIGGNSNTLNMYLSAASAWTNSGGAALDALDGYFEL